MSLGRLRATLEQGAPAGERAAVSAESERCVRRFNRENPCRLCIDGCPTQAIGFAPEGIAFDAAACVACGFCVRVCPTGVFDGHDETPRLLQCVAALPHRTALDLLCSYAPATASGGGDATVQIEGCLASLGTAAYLGLAALGVERVGVRVEACAECPIGVLRGEIERVCEDARCLAQVDVAAVDVLPRPTARVPLHTTRAPQMSRRSLFRRAVGSEPPLALLPDASPPNGKAPPRERRALLHVLEHLPAERIADSAYFPLFAASAACTACQVCATVCPTGALWFEAVEGVFELGFAPLACTECGLCVELCAPGALQPVKAVAYAEAQPVVLLSGSVRECNRCHALYVGEGPLCPACAFRREHPFGSRPRPGA